MDYSIDQVLSVITLIEKSSIYSLPLLMGLILPLFWGMAKKVLGISFNTTPPTLKIINKPTNRLKKIVYYIRKFWNWLLIKIKTIDKEKMLFKFSFFLVVLGIPYLKYGAYQIEGLRQDALRIKHQIISAE